MNPRTRVRVRVENERVLQMDCLPTCQWKPKSESLSLGKFCHEKICGWLESGQYIPTHPIPKIDLRPSSFEDHVKAAAAWSLGQIGMEAHGIMPIRLPSVADRLVSMCVLPVQTQKIKIFEKWLSKRSPSGRSKLQKDAKGVFQGPVKPRRSILLIPNLHTQNVVWLWVPCPRSA